MSNKYQAVAKVLLATKDQIHVLLVDPADELHRLKLEQELQKLADFIVLITGAGDIQAAQTTALGPATTIGGQPIGKIKKITEADLVPSDDKLFNLKQSVEAAYETFYETPAESILANMGDIVIRGVAKKAGLKGVTKENPKDITIEFVADIKEAIVKKDGKPSRELTQDELIAEFKEQVASALHYFGPDADSNGILEHIPAPIVRGVAKRAGVHIPDNEVTTVEHIDQIKAFLHPKAPVQPQNTTATDKPDTPVIDLENTEANGTDTKNQPADAVVGDQGKANDLKSAQTAEGNTAKAIDMTEAKADTKKGKAGK